MLTTIISPLKPITVTIPALVDSDNIIGIPVTNRPYCLIVGDICSIQGTI